MYSGTRQSITTTIDQLPFCVFTKAWGRTLETAKKVHFPPLKRKRPLSQAEAH